MPRGQGSCPHCDRLPEAVPVAQTERQTRASPLWTSCWFARLFVTFVLSFFVEFVHIESGKEREGDREREREIRSTG